MEVCDVRVWFANGDEIQLAGVCDIVNVSNCMVLDLVDERQYVLPIRNVRTLRRSAPYVVKEKP